MQPILIIINMVIRKMVLRKFPAFIFHIFCDYNQCPWVGLLKWRLHCTHSVGYISLFFFIILSASKFIPVVAFGFSLPALYLYMIHSRILKQSTVSLSFLWLQMSVSLRVLMIFSFFQTRTLPYLTPGNYQHSCSLAVERSWDSILYINLYLSPSFSMAFSSTFSVKTKFGVSQLHFSG